MVLTASAGQGTRDVAFLVHQLSLPLLEGADVGGVAVRVVDLLNGPVPTTPSLAKANEWPPINFFVFKDIGCGSIVLFDERVIDRLEAPTNSQ